MNVSYDYFKIFYFVAKCGSFTKAAESLYANQPNVTRTIKLLEEQLGCALFTRTKRKVMLTAEGEKLYRHVRIAFEHIAMGEEELLADRQLQSGSISIGTSETALYGLLLPVLKKFRAGYGGIRLKVGNFSTVQAISALNEGFVDFAVVTSPLDRSDSLSVTELRSFREIAVCGNGFPELIGKEISLKTFAEYPVVGLGRSTKTYDFYREQFALHGLRYNPEIEVATADQILPMIKNDIGIGFLPEFFLADDRNVHRLALREELSERAICLVKRIDRPLSLAAKQLEQEILSFGDGA